MLRVTADSNIYLSAMNVGGAPDKLLDMARNGDIVLAISDPIVEEVTHPRRAIDVAKEDPSDNRILERSEAAVGLSLSSREMHIS
jgi:hypothetical protein